MQIEVENLRQILKDFTREVVDDHMGKQHKRRTWHDLSEQTIADIIRVMNPPEPPIRCDFE